MSAPASAKSHTKGEHGERAVCSEGSEEARRREERKREEEKRKRKKEKGREKERGGRERGRECQRREKGKVSGKRKNDRH